MSSLVWQIEWWIWLWVFALVGQGWSWVPMSMVRSWWSTYLLWYRCEKVLARKALFRNFGHGNGWLPILKEDNWTCYCCNSQPLRAHRIKYEAFRKALAAHSGLEFFDRSKKSRWELWPETGNWCSLLGQPQKPSAIEQEFRYDILIIIPSMPFWMCWKKSSKWSRS